MISTFVLLTIVGGVCRLGLNWVLRRKLAIIPLKMAPSTYVLRPTNADLLGPDFP